MTDVDVAAICEEIRKNYSPCDVSDALHVLLVPGAGHLADIHPIPTRGHGKNRLVAPISTVVFVDKNSTSGGDFPHSNLPKDKHWTDVAPPGSVVLMQQPADQIVGVLGDIVATTFKTRGVLGTFVDGRTRDIAGCGALCEDGKFQCWTGKLSSVGTSLQSKPWAVDVPLKFGLVSVRPGDILVADEAEQVCTVIPQDKLIEVAAWLPKLKAADEEVLCDAQRGISLKQAFASHQDHYTNQL